jgi:hypothetical protein
MRHTDIQDDYVWAELDCRMDQRAAIGHNANHLKLRLQQALASLCQETMIIGKQNATGRLLFSHKNLL